MCAIEINRTGHRCRRHAKQDYTVHPSAAPVGWRNCEKTWFRTQIQPDLIFLSINVTIRWKWERRKERKKNFLVFFQKENGHTKGFDIIFLFVGEILFHLCPGNVRKIMVIAEPYCLFRQLSEGVSFLLSTPLVCEGCIIPHETILKFPAVREKWTSFAKRESFQFYEVLYRKTYKYFS